MLSTFITNANTLSTTFIPGVFFTFVAEHTGYNGRKICQFKLIHFSKSVPVHTVSAPSCFMCFHVFGTFKTCVYVLLSHIVHIQYCVFLWTLLIGRLNISPQFMSINLEYGQGLYELLNTHASPANSRGQTGKENSSIRRRGREGGREGGKKIVVGNMTKLLLSPYGCSTSDLRGQRTFFFFF